MKSKIKINRIMFPKNTTKTKAGDFCIFTATIVEHLEGKEPVVNPIYKTISLKAMKENSKEHVCIQRMSGWCELMTKVFESIPELLIGNNSKIRRIPTLQD